MRAKVKVFKKDETWKSTDHLLPAVGGKVKDKDGEEGDAHAGDDQVHLEQILKMETADHLTV